MSPLAPTLQAFFTDRLVRQRQASPQTIASYRDTFKLLVAFVERETGAAPSRLTVGDLNAEVVAAFLDHLESERGNTARTRNARLGAIRSFFRYAALRHPEHAETIQQVLAIPQKRFSRPIVSFLSRTELDALLAAPDAATWEGRRDRALILLGAQAGLRVSELVGLNCSDLRLGPGSHIRCEGKGRKERTVPLTGTTEAVLRRWTRERGGLPADPLFPTRTGRRLSRDAVERRLTIHSAAAAQRCPSLRSKRVTPHVLRHTAAMSLLHAGVDTTVISLWLGHSDVRATNAYLQADMTIKERALALTTPANVRPGRYRPPDALLAFLEGL